MATDRRSKGCPNETCDMHIKKIRQKAVNQFCPICGEPLIFVCAKCFSQIEDNGYTHKICSLCQAKKDEKKERAEEKVKDVAGKVVKGAAVAVGGVVVAVVAKVGGKVKDTAVDAGVKVAEEAIKKVFK